MAAIFPRRPLLGTGSSYALPCRRLIVISS
jgi:hypothetical protein